MDPALKQQAESLACKVKHYLITTMGVTLDEATDEEFYCAFVYTLREEIRIFWTACAHAQKKTRCRMLYYFCMEYMPGRFLGNNVANMHATELVCAILQMLGKTLEETLRYEPDPGLGNGGLGRLAACFLDSLATQHYPAVAYGLRFQYGIFDQEIWDGVQVERPEVWLRHENPWEYRRDIYKTIVRYAGVEKVRPNKKGEEVGDLVDYDEVSALPYDIPIVGYRANGCFSVNTLRLWTTKESLRNFKLQRYNAGFLDQAAENTSLTDILYPNDDHEMGKRVRLKQEFLLVSASLQDVIRHHLDVYKDLKEFADKTRIQINDTHPALVIAELQRILMYDHDWGWDEAWEAVKTCCSFTNHTILPEALEEWNQHRVQQLLPRQYRIIERLNQRLCDTARSRFPGDEQRIQRMSMLRGGQIEMAHLALFGSHRVNGVSSLHTEILKTEVFKDFYDLFPEKFLNITNGVTQRRWLLCANPSLAQFISERIGDKWITDFKEISRLVPFATDPQSQKRFIEVKQHNKRRLLDFIKRDNPLRDAKGSVVGYYSTLDEMALFDMQIKRIHEYKRQLLNLLHVIMIYHELKANPQARSIARLVIFGGKAAPGYTVAKSVIQLICAVARTINYDPQVKQRLHVVFIENYNVSKAEQLIPAADLSEQISLAGTEASGTGNMKMAMNGALTIGTEDGANLEMRQAVGEEFWPFAFGKNAAENAQLKLAGSYDPLHIYTYDPLIRDALNSLKDRTFARTDAEHDAFVQLYSSLLDANNSHKPDRFFVLNDLRSYYDTQKKVEALFLQPLKWAEYALRNLAAMGSFSSDESIACYAKKVWDLQSCPCDPLELDRVKKEYGEHDRCHLI